MARKNRRPRDLGPAPDQFRVRPVATLDLHGFSGPEVEGALATFLVSWRKRARGATVHVITGKGRGSVGLPVIKPRVRRLLAEVFNEQIAGFELDDAGGGFYVRLK